MQKDWQCHTMEVSGEKNLVGVRVFPLDIRNHAYKASDQVVLVLGAQKI